VDHIPSSPVQVRVGWNGVIATATVSGELDITNAPALYQRLMKVAATRPERLVLDLGGLVFVDVAGARALDCARQALEVGCPVILRGARPSAREVFRLTGLMEGWKAGRSPA
jgi:anti-anti-sigma factor